MSGQVNEDYVRGFFDGGGCVHVAQRMLILTNTNKNIIDDICIFLKSIKIKTHVMSRTPQKPHHNVCYDIRIHDYFSVQRFFHLIGTNHEDKYLKFLRVLRSYVKIPLSETEKRKLIEMRNDGHTYRYIANFLNRSVGTIHYVYQNYLAS